jgi:hypothetical protein
LEEADESFLSWHMSIVISSWLFGFGLAGIFKVRLFQFSIPSLGEVTKYVIGQELDQNKN